MIAIASRVVDTRTSEPAETRMSVDELTSLSRYLYVLKSGSYDRDSDASFSSIGHYSTIVNRQPYSPRIELLVDSDEIVDQQQDTISNTHLYPNDRITTPVFEQKRHLSSLGNIFPFSPINQAISRSASENSQEQSDHGGELSERDPLLPLGSSNITKKRNAYNLKVPIASIHSWLTYIQNQFLQINYQRPYASTPIRFEGWALYIFGPTSITRFYLWKFIGSRYEMLCIVKESLLTTPL